MALKAYKGRPEIVSNLKPSDVVQVDQEIAYSRGVSLPELLIVDRCYAMYGSYSLQHRSPSSEFALKSTHYNPGDFPVKVLTGTKASKIREESKKILVAPSAVLMRTGSDPEIFVSGGDGKTIPSWMFLPGKDKPAIAAEYPTVSGQTPDKPVGGNHLYWDGFQAEFTVSDHRCLAWTIDSIQRGLAGVLIEARKFDPAAKLSHHTVIPVEEDVLKSTDIQYIQFGCMPSKNVYGLSGRGENGRDVPFRFAGGHIHLGLTGGIPDQEVTSRIVRALDSIVGIACVSLFENHDIPVRREYYGMAGEYRTPKHGLEYRVLSNAWLTHPLVANLVFNLSRITVAYGIQNLDGWKAKEDEVIQAIQNCDVGMARKILSDNNRLLAMLFSRCGYLHCELAAKLMGGPIEAFVEDPADIEKNWVLSDPSKWITHCNGPGKNWSNSAEKINSGGKV